MEQTACCARVSYSPTLQQQTSVSSNGLHADFIIQYDVALRELLGEVQVGKRVVFLYLLNRNKVNVNYKNLFLYFDLLSGA